jgi:hypothetical protein
MREVLWGLLSYETGKRCQIFGLPPLGKPGAMPTPKPTPPPPCLWRTQEGRPVQGQEWRARFSGTGDAQVYGVEMYGVPLRPV